MLTIISTKQVVRAERKVGKVVVKAVNMTHVEAMQDFVTYGLNVHACGKVEFFREGQYADGSRSLAGVYQEMMRVAKAA